MNRRNVVKLLSLIAVMPYGGLRFIPSNSNRMVVKIAEVGKTLVLDLVYTKKVCRDIIASFKLRKEAMYGCIGFDGENFDIPCDEYFCLVSLQSRSHLIKGVFIHHGFLCAEIEILDTPAGKKLSTLIREDRNGIAFRPFLFAIIKEPGSYSDIKLETLVAESISKIENKKEFLDGVA